MKYDRKHFVVSALIVLGVSGVAPSPDNSNQWASNRFMPRQCRRMDVEALGGLVKAQPIGNLRSR